MRQQKILVVEDSPSLAATLRVIVERHGYAVQQAPNGAEGVRIATEWLPDAVLMDLNMPVMDGFEAAAAIRNDPRTRWIPVMATTALEQPEDVVRALMAGFNRYICKPYDEQRVIAQLEDLLRTSRRRRRLAALAGTRADEVAPIAFDRDRQQMLEQVLRLLQREVDCDLFAVGWSREGSAGLLLTVDAAGASDRLQQNLERRIWGETDVPQQCDRLMVLTGKERPGDAPFPDDVGVSALVPLVLGPEAVGMMLVGSFAGSAFDAAALEAIDRISNSFSQTLQRDVVVAGRMLQDASGSALEQLVREVDVMVVAPETLAAQWVAAIEMAVHGLQTQAASTLQDVTKQLDDPLLVLVDSTLVDEVNALSAQRAGEGLGGLPTMALYSSEVEADERRLATFVLMSLMLALMDSCRTGCLHLQRHGGRAAGLLVFRDGRLAWANSSVGGPPLLSLLADIASIDPKRLQEVVRLSVAERASFVEVAQREQLFTAAQYEEALKSYITAAVGELLKLDRPELFWSHQVRVGQSDLTFDGTEIVMSSMFA